MSIFYTGCTTLLSLMSLLIVILLTSTCIQIHSCDINLSINDKHCVRSDELLESKNVISFLSAIV